MLNIHVVATWNFEALNTINSRSAVGSVLSSRGDYPTGNEGTTSGSG
jgi:hypothetical protein